MHNWHMGWDSRILGASLLDSQLKQPGVWVNYHVSSCVHLCNWTSDTLGGLYNIHAQKIRLWIASLLYRLPVCRCVFLTPGCHAMLPMDQRLNLLELEVQQLRAHQNHASQWLSLQDVPMMYLVGLKTPFRMRIYKMISYQLEFGS